MIAPLPIIDPKISRGGLEGLAPPATARGHDPRDFISRGPDRLHQAAPVR